MLLAAQQNRTAKGVVHHNIRGKRERDGLPASQAMRQRV